MNEVVIVFYLASKMLVCGLQVFNLAQKVAVVVVRHRTVSFGFKRSRDRDDC